MLPETGTQRERKQDTALRKLRVMLPSKYREHRRPLIIKQDLVDLPAVCIRACVSELDDLVDLEERVVVPGGGVSLHL